ncbi:11817_t:CDS:1, partial [Funneliformis caledonium]
HPQDDLKLLIVLGHHLYYNDDFHKLISEFENNDLLLSQKVLELVKLLVEDMEEHEDNENIVFLNCCRIG